MRFTVEGEYLREPTGHNILRIIETLEPGYPGSSLHPGLYVQSSCGARCAVDTVLSHGPQLLTMIDRVEMMGIAYDAISSQQTLENLYGREVSPIRFGSWYVFAITTPNSKRWPSTVQIGCQRFKISEIRRIAEILGIMTLKRHNAQPAS